MALTGKHAMAPVRRLTLSAVVALAVMPAAVPALAAPRKRPIVRAAPDALRAVAEGLAVGDAVRLEGLPLEGTSGVASAELERVEVFPADAEIVVYGDHGEQRLPVPSDTYLRGYLDPDLSSTVVVTVPKKGHVRGIVRSANGVWTVETRNGRIVTRRKDVRHEPRRFRCETEELPGGLPSGLGVASEPAVAEAVGPAVTYSARVAVETDYEFFQLPAFGGSTTNATKYVGDVFAYISSIYQAEVGTSLVVGSLHVRTSSADPWTATTTSNALYEVRDYWRANYAGVSRSTVHFLSGKRLGGGIAYLGSLCDNNYGYGVSGSLAGNWTGSGIVWDTMVVAHEIGHNFNSPHTHCYAGIGGSSEPVDRCYGSESGCYAGAVTLPCGTAGGGCGTIMSYCHQLSGGLSNISMTFGLNDPYGTLSSRVPTRMWDHVRARASSNPSCLAPAAPGPSAPSATTGAATSLGTGTAVLNGSVNPNGSATTVQFQWGTTTAYGNATASQAIGSGASAVGVSANLAGLSPSTTYHYRVVATNAAGTVFGQNVTLTTASAGCTTAPIGFGQTISGALSTTDCRSPIRSASHFADRYTFSGTSGQQIVVAMGSTGFDTYLYLVGPGGTVVTQDDDSGDGTNSRIPPSGTFTLPSTGTYVIEATSYASAAVGSYTLTLTLTGSLAPSAATSAATSVGASSAVLNGSVNPNGSATTVSFQWGTTTAYGNTTVSQSIGSGTGAVAVAATLTSLSSNTTYHYRVVATNGAGTVYGQNVTLTTTSAGCTTAPIVLGQTMSGALSATDCRSPIRGGSYYADRYTFSGASGQRVVITMRSSTFNTYLYLVGPNGAVVAQDDDGGSGSNSRISRFTLSATGTYRIEATSSAVNATGSYTLSLSSS